MKKMITTGVAAGMCISMSALAQSSTQNRDLVAIELLGSNDQIVLKHNTFIGNMDQSISDLVEFTQSSSLDMNEELFAQLLAPQSNANMGSIGSMNTSSFGQSQQINPADLSNKTNPTVIVPLPSAALAGMGLLVGLMGVGIVRGRSKAS